jgi:alkyl hydroperoxide reductase subunit AhpC
MTLRINDEAPNFTAETIQGPITLHDRIGDEWAVLFSHPKDFTPVCTTELGYMAGLTPEFEKRHCPHSCGVTLTTEDPTNVPIYEHVGYAIVGTARVSETLET